LEILEVEYSTEFIFPEQVMLLHIMKNCRLILVTFYGFYWCNRIGRIIGWPLQVNAGTIALNHFT